VDTCVLDGVGAACSRELFETEIAATSRSYDNCCTCKSASFKPGNYPGTSATFGNRNDVE